MSCEICKEKILIPLTLDCDHKCCFICLKINNYLDSEVLKCPLCCKLTNNLENILSKVSINTMVSKKIWWGYSTTYGNKWWCYLDNTNDLIEKYYQHYLNKNRVVLNNNISVFKAKPNTKIDTNNFKSIVNDCDDIIIFEDDVIKTSKRISIKELYNIKLGSTTYKINFDNNTQTNINDITKKRSIRRFIIPNNISNIKEFINIMDDIIGIGGIKV